MSKNVLVVNAEGPETRVGVLEDGQLAEHYLERKRERGIVGNIYRGRITRVLPGMQAAFVDLGPTVEKAAFLYVADILGAADIPTQLTGTEVDESPEGAASRMMRSRKQAASRKIEDLVKAGQHVLVQIVKDPIGPKGARVTGYLSLPGRYGVLMPTVDHVGVSRRISTDDERKRLRKLIDDLRPKGMGFIVRTAAEGAPSDEVSNDFKFLVRLWAEIKDREKKVRKAGLVYADLDMVLRTIRDLLHEDTEAIYIDDEEQFDRAHKFVSAFLPAYVGRVRRYDGRQPIFDHFGIEPALRTAMSRHVPLESGGSLVIDQGEALTAIDVNTGSFVGRNDLESTVTANNLEASTAIARQLRLRNIGGIIVLDFVDMDKQSNRKKVWEMFNKALESDRSHCNVTKISELGLVEMTRKRTRESLNQLLSETCPSCDGAGRIKSATTVAYEVLRDVRRLGATVTADSIAVECSARVREVLAVERDYFDFLEKKFHKMIEIITNSELKPDQYKVAGHLGNATPEPKQTRKRQRPAKRPSAKRSGSRRGGSRDATREGRGREGAAATTQTPRSHDSEPTAEATTSVTATPSDLPGVAAGSKATATAAESVGTKTTATAKKPSAVKKATASGTAAAKKKAAAAKKSTAAKKKSAAAKKKSTAAKKKSTAAKKKSAAAKKKSTAAKKKSAAAKKKSAATTSRGSRRSASSSRASGPQ